VISIEFCGANKYTRFENRRIKLVLDCGHFSIRKQSVHVPKKVHCTACPMELRYTREIVDTGVDSSSGGEEG
jgi:hypothetical protein